MRIMLRFYPGWVLWPIVSEWSPRHGLTVQLPCMSLSVVWRGFFTP